jgi:anthranilate/para-aminobenzoate synthase component I
VIRAEEPFGPRGDAIAPPTASVGSMLAALGPERTTLALASSNDRGWFGGVSALAFDPVGRTQTGAPTGIQDAGAALEATLWGDGPFLTAALVTYEGAAQILAYDAALVRTERGWQPCGKPEAKVPGLADALRPDTAGEPLVLPEDEPLVREIVPGMDREGFESGVREVRERIAAGDVYVLNLTYRMAGRASMQLDDGRPDAAGTFATLLARGHAPMSAALVTPARAVLSVSPERFLAIDGRNARIEPIKGTRPRGRWPDEDTAFVAELAASVKERAEHVMIVDLERNDLGRVSEWETVYVDPLAQIVPTPYCHQMVSTVHGTLRGYVGLTDVLDATFPCGSVTGAPKIAAMRHIARLERSPRGVYCGALLVATRGRLDSSVLIRTAQIDGERIVYGTGGGITFDSDPAQEWEETLVKARPFLGSGATAFQHGW